MCHGVYLLACVCHSVYLLACGVMMCTCYLVYVCVSWLSCTSWCVLVGLCVSQLSCVCHGVYLLSCVCHGVYLLACMCHFQGGNFHLKVWGGGGGGGGWSPYVYRRELWCFYSTDF